MFAKNDHFHQQGMFTKQIAEVHFFQNRIISLFLDFMKLLIVLENSTKARIREGFILRKNS